MKRIWMPLFLLASLLFIGQYFYHQAGHLNGALHLTPRFLVIAFVLHLIYWFFAVHCWQRIVVITTQKKIGFIQGFRHLALVALGKYFPGKIWGMVARATMLKQQGVALHLSMHATLNEQFLLLHAGALLCAALLYIIEPSIYTVVLCMLAIVSVVLIVPLQKITFRILARLGKKTWRNELKEAKLLTFRQSAGLLVGYVMVWLMIGLIFSCIYFALFTETLTVLMVMRLVLANTVGITLGFFAIFSPGGIGVREAVTSALLASQLPLEEALLLSLVFRLWIVISEVLSGIALLVPEKIDTGEEAL